MVTLVLVHGGLWDDLDAQRFWVQPGIVDGLRAACFAVSAPDRPRQASSWVAEAEHLAGLMPAGPVTLVAGSDGCAAAVALALSRPVLVEKLVLAWPASAGDPDVDGEVARRMAERGADRETIDALLAGDTLRGFSDDQLAALPLPVGVLPAIENRLHRRATVDRLLKAVPSAVELAPATPEPTQADFPAYREGFVEAVRAFTVGA